METQNIKNVVFDIGNVIVRWSPVEIIKLTLGSVEQPEQIAKAVFQDDVWVALNRGKMTEAEAKIEYQNRLGFSAHCTDKLFYYVKHTQILLFGSVELLKRVKAAGYSVYALTDNVLEIIDHLKSHYDFWPLFDGAIVSAEVGYLKPRPEIFKQLLEQQKISAAETVFIDDMSYNVEGARSLGFAAIQFENTVQCERKLKLLGVSF